MEINLSLKLEIYRSIWTLYRSN